MFGGWAIVRKTLLAGVLLGAASVAMAGAGLKFTYVDLVKKLTDLEGLAVLPVAGEKCRQWSSYDRASRYDASTGNYLAWGANGDAHGIIRTEDDTEVLAEMEGPGVIWRIWSAAPREGHVRIFLDGAPEPAVDLPFIGFFDGKNAPFNFPSIVNEASRGQNSYLPIPFQQSCKIVGDKGWGDFYHFTYATYPKDTTLPTFRRELKAAEISALYKIDAYLTNGLGTDPTGPRKGEKTEIRKVAVPSQGTVTVATLNGKRAITALRVKLDPRALGDASRTLRELVLRITWDGDKSPSVWAPLGDFFGTAPGINPYKSLPLGMVEDKATGVATLYCLWYMPFGKSAKIELVNDGRQSFPVEFQITHAPLSLPVSQLGRFHAKWHRDALLNTAERALDWPMLKTDGRGRFCGVALHIWNPRGGWWGEGDEKFFVDGEKFPSTFGTGSEDYFGYAWGDPTLFQRVYHDQTVCDGIGGNTSLNRWQITDNGPFQTSFEASIEKYWGNERPCQYAAVAYFYLAAGQADPYLPVEPATERTDYQTQLKSYREPGVLEAEELKLLRATGGMYHERHRMLEWGDIWSNGYCNWWERPGVGDKATLALPVTVAGRYELKVQFCKSSDCAAVQMYLDGEKIGDPIDPYGPEMGVTGALPLGVRELASGEHKLTLEVVGSNDKADKARQVRMDYVKLEKTLQAVTCTVPIRMRS